MLMPVALLVIAGTALGSIVVYSNAVPRLALCVRELLAASVSVSALVAGHTHSNAIAQAIIATGSDGKSVVSVPIAAKRLIAPAAVAAMFHRTLALAARAAIRGSLGLFAKGHNGSL